MEFCPTCANMLLYELPYLDRPARFFCRTCPYVYHLERGVKIKRKQRLIKKPIEPIFTQDDDLKNAPKTEVRCPMCGHGFAAYMTMQTRSADEPETILYACLEKNCGHKWRE